MGWDAVGLNSLHGSVAGLPNRLGGSCIYTMASRPTVLVTVKLSVQIHCRRKSDLVGDVLLEPPPQRAAPRAWWPLV
jgi:hypothetical protein